VQSQSSHTSLQERQKAMGPDAANHDARCCPPHGRTAPLWRDRGYDSKAQLAPSMTYEQFISPMFLATHSYTHVLPECTACCATSCKPVMPFVISPHSAEGFHLPYKPATDSLSAMLCQIHGSHQPGLCQAYLASECVACLPMHA